MRASGIRRGGRAAGWLAAALALTLATAPAGCARISGLFSRDGGGERVFTYEGRRFDARASASEADAREIVVTVSPASISPRGAQEAGRYEAYKYCLRNYGGSDIDWQVGPDAPASTLRIVDDTLVLAGRCTQR